MCTNLHRRAFAATGLALLLTGCAGLPEAYPPPSNPFLAGAAPLASTTLAQPAKVGLVWLAPVGSAVPPQAAQQRLVDKIKAQFAAGKRLEIVGATMIAAPQGDMLAEVRKASAPFNVNQVLVVMPTGTEVVSPVWLQYGRAGRAVGTRTDSYFTVSLVGLEPEDADELLGLYWGRSIHGNSFFDTGGQLPDRIYVYSGPILRLCENEEEVIREVQETVVHEIGHHFGLSDDDMPY